MRNSNKSSAQAGSSPGQAQLASYMAERQRMLDDYDRYVAGLYDRKLNEKEKLILRVTRMFGECDVAAPPDYVGEVIALHRQVAADGKLRASAETSAGCRVSAEDRGRLHGPGPAAAVFLPRYAGKAISIRMRLGARRGGASPKACGSSSPKRDNGSACRPGPLASQRVTDELDDRFNWEKATPAAAKYIKDIYSTDAQASGLLVMASYNWGEVRIIDLLRQMPADPRQRNFWKLLAQYRGKMPLETYEYVFYIVAAAVIGENPRLFGFPFDNPLAFTARPMTPASVVSVRPAPPAQTARRSSDGAGP